MIWLGIVSELLIHQCLLTYQQFFEMGYVDSIIDLPTVIIELTSLRSEYEEGVLYLTIDLSW